MNPRGQVQDLTMLKKQGFAADPTPMSPDVCFDLVRDLNAPKGKGKLYSNLGFNKFSRKK